LIVDNERFALRLGCKYLVSARSAAADPAPEGVPDGGPGQGGLAPDSLRQPAHTRMALVWAASPPHPLQSADPGRVRQRRLDSYSGPIDPWGRAAAWSSRGRAFRRQWRSRSVADGHTTLSQTGRGV